MSWVQVTGIVICGFVGLFVVVGGVWFVFISAMEEDERWAQWTLTAMVAAFLTAAALAAFGVFG